MYTPKMSDVSVISLRRLARAPGTPMGAALNRMVRLMPVMVDPVPVCARRKDSSKCSVCIFKTPVTENDKDSLTAREEDRRIAGMAV